MSYTLRPHQEKNRLQLSGEFAIWRAVILAAECGYGKGTITADIIERVSKRGKYTLFLVHGKDRVVDMDERVTGLGVPHGVLMGSHRRERWHQTQIASSDTVYRMEHKPRADLIIIDECHLAMSPTFRAVLDCYPNAKILGLSATPQLGNGRPLGKKSGGIFESMVRGPSVNQLIREGSLVGSRVFAPDPPEGMRSLKKKKNGEFDENAGAAIADKPRVIGDMVEHYRKHGTGRKAVTFGFHQKHAFDIAESFRAAGYNWAYVDASTPMGSSIHDHGSRKWIWHQYDRGDLLGVAACAVISIGWDHSICKYLGFGSKTSSFPLFRQRLGRGSRPHPGFSDFVVVDHCGGLYEFPEEERYFESEIDWPLDGEPKKHKVEDDEAGFSVRRCPECYFTFRSTSVRVCPACGKEIPLKLRKIEEQEGDLQEVKRAGLSQSQLFDLGAPQGAPQTTPPPPRPKRHFTEREKAQLYQELRKRQIGEGYPDTWLRIAFNAQVGHFPSPQYAMESPAEIKSALNQWDAGEL